MNGEAMDACCSFEDLAQRAGEAKHEGSVSEPQNFLAMALALRQTPNLLSLPLFQSWVPWSIPSLQSLLDLFPPFLLAVPKSKVSHSRKAMRSANKGLKDKQSIYSCTLYKYSF